MTNSLPVSRRTFLQTTGAVAATAALTAKSYARVIGANDRIRVGFVGSGGQGLANINTVHDLEKSNNVEGIVVADCWKTRADEGAGVFSAAKAVTDYRHVLDNKEVDYVTIAVPEHSHAGVTIAAFEAGKPVYCEKPMTHTIEQGWPCRRNRKRPASRCRSACRPCRTTATGRPPYGHSPGRARQGGPGANRVRPPLQFAGPGRVPGLDPKMAKPHDLDWDTWLGVAPKSIGTRTTSSSGGTTRSTRAASAPTSLFIASPAS